MLAHMFVLFLYFWLFCCVCLCSPPSSMLFAHLGPLLDSFIVTCYVALTPAFICSLMCMPPSCGLSLSVRGLIALYFLSFGLCTCALTRLFIKILGFWDRFYFIDSVGASGHVYFHLSQSAFVCVLRLLLSPLSFEGFVHSRIFYACAFLPEPLVF
jgi:hypothetical protein